MDASSAGPTPLGELTRRMARGDDAAWQEFHVAHGPGMFRHLLACTRGDHALASEALQGAYLRVARHVRVCDNEPQWSAWLRLVARSELHDLRRTRSRFMRFLLRWQSDRSAHETEAEEGPLFAALDDGFAQLDRDTQSLLDAKYLRGETVAAIAARLGISPKAVESRLTRARAELRRLIEAALQTHSEHERVR